MRFFSNKYSLILNRASDKPHDQKKTTLSQFTTHRIVAVDSAMCPAVDLFAVLNVYVYKGTLYIRAYVYIKELYVYSNIGENNIHGGSGRTDKLSDSANKSRVLYFYRAVHEIKHIRVYVHVQEHALYKCLKHANNAYMYSSVHCRSVARVKLVAL